MAELTYSSYLMVDELLSLQRPQSDGPEHDEMLFIIIHQSYELWFRSLLHETARAQELLETSRLHEALATIGRTRTIMKALVAQVDILETMTPLQFNSFRSRLESSSGFQSAQFRELEAVLGSRRADALGPLVVGSQARQRVEAAMNRRSLWDSLLVLLHARTGRVPADVLSRDVSLPHEQDPRVQEVLIEAYRNDPEAALLLERFVDLDEGLQEWRYRHVKMVERTIGAKVGTGGSSGRGYLLGTLFRPVFPDLWAIRDRF